MGKCSKCGRNVDKLYGGECIYCINKETIWVKEKIPDYEFTNEVRINAKSIEENFIAGRTSDFMLKKNNINALVKHTRDFICKGKNCSKCSDNELRRAIAKDSAKFKGKIKCEEIKEMIK